MKKFMCINICALLILYILSGCSNKAETKIDENSIYNFVNYQNDEITDIEQIKLNNDLNQSCISYKFTYYSDYYQIKAYISIPIKYIEKQIPCKCILYNRGGNSRIGLLEDDDTAKICASTNRVVIASQYRGADGGTGNDEFGGDDLNDVIKLIDLCEKHFSFVDMNDFCVAGVSRGGMMTYMTAKQDDRVKRIIAISAVSDLFQSYEQREDMKKLLYNYIGGFPEDLPDEYEKRSAIYWAEEIKTPVLVIHSKYDEQVAFSQAEDLCNKFKQNNIDYTFITHNDNVHGLHEKDIEAIKDWLNTK